MRNGIRVPTVRKNFQTPLLISAILALIGVGAGRAAAAALPVFPGASGYGTTTAAGSGRHLKPPRVTVFQVSNLKNSGAGSLRACVESNTPRTCVFTTSGVIRLSSELKIRYPYLTIAGQTAPAPGILLRGAPLIVSAHDVLVQHMEIRVGGDSGGIKPANRDGITVLGSSGGTSNIVVDHVSVSWAVDENFSTYGDVRDVTVSNCVFAEALERSIHPKGPHSKGILVGVGTERISVHDSLLAHNVERNPYLLPGTAVEFVNNVVYNWAGKGGWNLVNLSDYDRTDRPVRLDFIGNYYKAGPESPLLAPVYAKYPAAGTRIYVQDNIGPSRLANEGDEWRISSMPARPYRSHTPAVIPSGVSYLPPEETYRSVLQRAGARPRERSAVDRRVISEVQSGKGRTKDCVQGCTKHAGGWPSLAANTRALVLPPNPAGDEDGDGYTNLEELLHRYASEIE